jgi:hypothetical protein
MIFFVILGLLGVVQADVRNFLDKEGMDLLHKGNAEVEGGHNAGSDLDTRSDAVKKSPVLFVQVPSST